MLLAEILVMAAMKRREFFSALLGSAAAAWPLAAHAQQLKKMPQIGFLTTGLLESSETRAIVSAFFRGMHELGYLDGQNVLVEIRAAGSQIERFPALASEFVALNPDVIVAPNSVAGRAVKQATTSIPIVVPVMGDPVADGLVASLARPGGNITGLTFLGPQLVPKRLALLKEALPATSQVAALWHPMAYGERTMNEMMKEAEAAAQSIGLRFRLIAVTSPDELERAFPTIAAERTEALFVFPSPMLFAERTRILDLAAKLRLPVIAMGKEFVQLGGLLSYGADITDSFRRSATYVDKILKGAKPADLPVEQPTKFELFVNLKTAKLLGLDIPATLLARADEVIE